jgi:hypothetical protein
MNWIQILHASLNTVAELSPTVLQQHWNGHGPNGKINNAIQILKDAAQVEATLEHNLANSAAAQNPHPEIAASAAKLPTAATQQA